MKNIWLKLKFSSRNILEFTIVNKLTIILTIVTVTLDIISKYLARMFLKYAEPVNILGDFLRLTLVFNRGVSFGILNSDQPTVIHAILPVLIVLIIFFLFYIFFSLSKEVDTKAIPLLKIGFGLIWGGGFGNLIDRLVMGYVTDFIDVGIKNIWRFYTFNIADSCITIGTILIIIAIVYSDLKKNEKYDGNN